MPAPPLSTLLSQVLVAFTIELDNEFERQFLGAGGRARVASVVMWSSFLRFVGDGIAVDELPEATGIPKSRVLSTLGGMERWRYVLVELEPGQGPPAEKRDGYGSARGLNASSVVRSTEDGRKAQAIWPGLFGQIEGRWEERFGAGEVGELRGALRPIVDRVHLGLPGFMPIVDGSNGMRLDLPPRETRAPDASLSAQLSYALLAYTREFERNSPLSLPLSANAVRVLDGTGVLVRDLPAHSGISKEAVSMALTFLTKAGFVEVEGASAATKHARLAPQGLESQRESASLHASVEKGWRADEVRSLRSALARLLGDSRFSRGLEPYPDGWRAGKKYVAQTRAVVDDPAGRLPQYPMVLHRGGWPDGA